MTYCLHLCNDLLGSKVHLNLYENLKKIGLKQAVFYPSRSHTIHRANDLVQQSDLKIIVSKPIKKYHRIFFRTKINFLYGQLEPRTSLDEFTIIHATTLFSDGALALKIHKKYKTPYIVSVRETDIGVFLRKRPDLIPLGLEILNKASKIIFIGDALKNKFFRHYSLKRKKATFEPKCLTIYNGIDKSWLEDRNIKSKKTMNRVLYVGSFIKRKNVISLAKAIIGLNKIGVNCHLTVVGSEGHDKNALIHLANTENCITYHGSVIDETQLKSIYRENDIFAMPSRNETFGLVYIEALSQGLPVLYSKNEGIDGIFDFKIGEKCDGYTTAEIMAGLNKMIVRQDDYSLDQIDFSLFDWKLISKKYIGLYDEVFDKNITKTGFGT